MKKLVILVIGFLVGVLLGWWLTAAWEVRPADPVQIFRTIA